MFIHPLTIDWSLSSHLPILPSLLLIRRITNDSNFPHMNHKYISMRLTSYIDLGRAFKRMLYIRRFVSIPVGANGKKKGYNTQVWFTYLQSRLFATSSLFRTWSITLPHTCRESVTWWLHRSRYLVPSLLSFLLFTPQQMYSPSLILSISLSTFLLSPSSRLSKWFAPLRNGWFFPVCYYLIQWWHSLIYLWPFSVLCVGCYHPASNQEGSEICVVYHIRGRQYCSCSCCHNIINKTITIIAN